MGVSRETSYPDTAERVFGTQAALMAAYVEILADQGVLRGLIGPREVPRLWDRHILNCGVMAGDLRPGSTVADIGSGAGLPGLVWAIARPDVDVTLIEPLLRRTTFLSEVVSELALENVQVVRGRADEVDGQFDVVTSRAVAALEKLVAWSMPLVRPGGTMWAIKGSSAQSEIDAARLQIRAAGGTNPRVKSYGDDVVETPTTMVMIDKVA